MVFTRLVEVQIWFQWVLGHSANVAGHTMPSCHLLGAHTPLWLGGVSWSSQGEASSFSGPKRPRFGPVKGGCTREIKSSVLELHYSVCPRFCPNLISVDPPGVERVGPPEAQRVGLVDLP